MQHRAADAVFHSLAGEELGREVLHPVDPRDVFRLRKSVPPPPPLCALPSSFVTRLAQTAESSPARHFPRLIGAVTCRDDDRTLSLDRAPYKQQSHTVHS